MQGRRAIALVVGLLGMGWLAVANPNQADYEDFATQELMLYAQENLCNHAPLGLSTQCQGFLHSNQAQIRRLIRNGTRRRNYGLFSLYQTDLSISSLVPAYRVEAIGILNHFLIYKVKQR
ncbi:MAG TPA: DUF4359 domain-containing protein [Coleofasciculaceae cyanobacterium]